MARPRPPALARIVKLELIRRNIDFFQDSKTAMNELNRIYAPSYSFIGLEKINSELE